MAPAATTSPPPASHWTYATVPGHYDEMLNASAACRPHWQTLLKDLTALGPEELDHRWQRGQQLIHENGVTYTIYGEGSDTSRPWQLDPIPLVISAAEWKLIESAAIQRAKLFNLVLADLYGKQSLLHSRALPAPAIFAQPSLVLPMIGVPVPANIYTHLHAIDLARAPGGQWWVIGDRTQAPSGMGYALENRSVLNRTLPDVVTSCNVTRLAAFFGHLNDTILSLAPPKRENPRVVLLTPGPYNETYFEHAYLARYLGYTLAEGRDLTVRDDRVYLKTLSGLLPVDVILRRTDDLYCDPLELREDSVLGIPGLLQAIRSGNVAIANALGSGLAQSPALLPFLPGLCRLLLAEDLKLPTVATWWCGQPKPLADVLSRLDRLVIKSALPGGPEPIFASSLSTTQRSELAARITASPRDWIAQEQVNLSTVPCWSGDKLVPRHTMLRIFVAARSDGSFTVMPGGLSRISASAESMVVSIQNGGGSKDTWVISDGPVNLANPLRPPGAPVEITRAGQVLPSRVADEMFWLGRYVERVEYGLRIARAIARRSASDPDEVASLFLLLEGEKPKPTPTTAPPTSKTPAPTPKPPPKPLPERLVESLFPSPSKLKFPSGVRADLDRVNRLAASLRDRLPGDAWNAIARLNESFTPPAAESALLLQHCIDTLDNASVLLSAFTGQITGSMSRDEGWAFLDLGRNLEHALHLTHLIAWAFPPPLPPTAPSLPRPTIPAAPSISTHHLDAILEITASRRTYRSRYQTTLQPAPVLDLILLDETNPQSLAFQLASAIAHAQSLPSEHRSKLLGDDVRILLKLLTRVRLFDLQSLSDPNSTPELTSLLTELRSELPQVSDILSRLYLSHARLSHQSRGRGK